MTGRALLALNSGSTSLKASLYGAVADLPALASVELDFAAGETPPVGRALAWADERIGGADLIGVVHRVVHGGARTEPAIVDDALLAELDRLAPLAPLHQPPALAAVRRAARERPQAPQVAAFDTAFHAGHAPVADRFGLPRAWEERGVRRYGFHGLSYQYLVARLGRLDPKLASGKIVACHLGGGASLCAIERGRSRATTMGLTPLDGLVMSSRSGALDPGAILYLMTEGGLSVPAVSDLLWRRSGLLGVSGISGDMQLLLASADPRAAEAVDLFVHRLVLGVGAMTAALGGVDGLVFTGGIGAGSPEIRRRACAPLGFMGVALDEGANAKGGGLISGEASRVAVWAFPTDEDLMMARLALPLFTGARHGDS